MTKPPLVAELLWTEGLRFSATSGTTAIVVDGNGRTGPSPMQLAAFGLAGCIASDIVEMLTRGRHPLTGLRVALSGERAPEPPRRFVQIALHFHVSGAVPPEAVDRAVALSREKYCSVWHSMRPDIALTTTFDVHP